MMAASRSKCEAVSPNNVGIALIAVAIVLLLLSLNFYGRKGTKKIPMLVKGVGINFLWMSINYELHEFDGFIV